MGLAGADKLITETRASQAQEPRQVGEWAGEGSIAPPRGEEGSLSCERDRDGPIHEVLQRLAAQVCVNVIQQIRKIV
jgi:hypothetical protein